MLDESMFEDIHEIAENSAYLKAVEEKDVSLEMLEQLPPYEDLRGLEEKLRFENKLSFDSIFNEPTGYYMVKCFLIADYAVDKAIFIKDVEAYKSMRFESARRKVALLLYQRFVATDDPSSAEFKTGSSVFQIIQTHKGVDDKSGLTAAKTIMEKSDNKSDKIEKTIVSSSLPSQSNMTQMSATTGHGLHHPGMNGGVGASDDYLGSALGRSRNESAFQMGTNNNPIGVYGKSIRIVKDRVLRGEAPKDLFDAVARDVMTDLKLDVFPRFQKSDFYKKYIRTKWIETQKVTVKDFTTFRVLGRGGFGAVHACRKKNSGQIYAMKCFPVDDTRILTNRGFMFLDEIQRANADLQYAAFDVKSEQIVYVPGELVLPPGDHHSLVNITADGEQRRWAEGSGVYGRDLPAEDKPRDHLSLRVTPDHHLYVQRGNQEGDATIAWSQDAPSKLEAGELLQACQCPADEDCFHRRAHARFTGVAVNGAASDNENVVRELLAARLGLRDNEAVDAFLELYGFWLGANGSIIQARDGDNCVAFSQVREDGVAWLEKQLPLCGLTSGLDYTVSDTIRLTNPDWFAFFDDQSVESTKSFSSWVWNLAMPRLRLVLRGLHRADANWASNVNAICTSSDAFRDALLRLCLHAGYSAHFDLQHEKGTITGYNLLDGSDERVYTAEEAAVAPELYRPIESTVESWRVHWSEPTSSSGQRACWPEVRLTDAVSMEKYQGRIWCVKVAHDDHLIFAQRALRGADGVVTKASQPIVVGQCINKKLVKVKSALDNVLEERNVLTMMKSHFVTNLKYAMMDEEQLFLVMDLCLGGDLKFHLINAGRFTEKRARFYAAQVLLGLEHVHKMSIIYRDMKLENVLLDGAGHCRLSDLGLAVVTKVKIKGYAGTPGYCFPAEDHQLMTAHGFMYLDDVQKHLSAHGTLDVACYVDGRLEFHGITADKVTVEDGEPMNLVEFRSDDDDISIEATAPHRMFGRLGAADVHSDGSMTWPTQEGGVGVPPRAIHSAVDIFTAGQADDNMVFQMTASFANGVATDVAQPAFVAQLGLETPEHIDAFLWIYGYWLGAGSVSASNSRVTFGPVSPSDFPAVDQVVARLPAAQQWQSELADDGRRHYSICSAAWSSCFAAPLSAELASKQYSSWVWRLGRDQFRTVLAGQRLADGAESEGTSTGGSIYTSSLLHRDEIVRACILAGYTAFFLAREGAWEVRYTADASRAEPKLLVRDACTMRKGVHTKVWCVSVPAKDNLIMFRRVLKTESGVITRASRPMVVGNTAPEMIKNKLYGPAADIFSYGVMIYRMLCGSKPFKGKVDRDLDKAVIERKPQFPKEIFSKEAISLLTGLLQKRPENRLGCSDKGIEDIKEHPFFESIDWGLLEAGYIDPPFVPNKFDVNAASLKDIGDFDRAKYKHVKLDERFKQRIKNFEYCSTKALQDEMVLVLEKADENVNFEKFAHQPEKQEQAQVVANGPCCSIV